MCGVTTVSRRSEKQSQGKRPGKCLRKTEDEESGLHYHNEEVPCISGTYEIWSPLDAAEAANVLLRMLEDDNQ